MKLLNNNLDLCSLHSGHFLSASSTPHTSKDLNCCCIVVVDETFAQNHLVSLCIILVMTFVNKIGHVTK